MRVLLDWLDNIACRWRQRDLDRCFQGVNPDSITDIDKFLRSKKCLY
jgi:hypothetical protein